MTDRLLYGLLRLAFKHTPKNNKLKFSTNISKVETLAGKLFYFISLKRSYSMLKIPI